MRKLYSIIVLSFLISNVVGALGQSPAAPSLRSSREVERRVDSILNQLTLEEKLTCSEASTAFSFATFRVLTGRD